MNCKLPRYPSWLRVLTRLKRRGDRCGRYKTGEDRQSSDESEGRAHSQAKSTKGWERKKLGGRMLYVGPKAPF